MILRLFSRLFSPSATRTKTHALYVQAVAAARAPHFYEHYGVADTIDGRFDMIALQVFLRSRALEDSHERDALMERMIADMDRSLREMGVGDVGVAKRVEKMAYALNGRMHAYEQAWGASETLAEALWRNVYRSDEAKREASVQLAQMLLAQDTHSSGHAA
jgi:cytochrome b pre-mRNA-processing protein 3